MRFKNYLYAVFAFVFFNNGREYVKMILFNSTFCDVDFDVGVCVIMKKGIL
jgi:hypothetical protein